MRRRRRRDRSYLNSDISDEAVENEEDECLVVVHVGSVMSVILTKRQVGDEEHDGCG